MRNIFIAIALMIGGQLLSIPNAVQAESLPPQESQQELLARRVTELEEALEQLRNEYGARLATIEA